MWGSLFLAVAVGVAALYVPGSLFARGLSLSRFESVLCAPLASMALYSIVTLAFSKTGVFCTGWLLMGTATAIGLAVWAGGAAVSRWRSLGPTSAASGLAYGVRCEGGVVVAEERGRLVLGWPGFALYAAVGIAVALFMFVSNMEAPDSFVQYYDNLHHLGAIQSFLVSGDWSSFGSTLYPTAADIAVRPADDSGGFYPSTWHAVTTIAASILGVSAPIAQNASLIAFSAIVFPLGVFLLLRTLFARKPAAVFFGSLAAMAFALFPWRLITFGPLFPNLAAFALMPSAAACFIALFDRDMVRGRRVTGGLLFIMALVGIAFTQPNVVFSLGVFLAPFIVVQAGRLADRLRCGDSAKFRARVAFVALAIVAIAFVWIACFKLPFLQGIVAYDWPSFLSGFDALKGMAKLTFVSLPSQLVLAVLVVVGMLCALRRREYLWLSVSYLLVCVMYVVGVSSDGVLKHVLTGFWYTDPYRVGTGVVMAAIPLVAFALGSLSDAAVRVAESRFDASARRALGIAVPCAIALVFTGANYWPNRTLTGTVDDGNAFDVAGKYLHEAFDHEGLGCYDDEERAFVDRVQEAVSPDDLIVNVPIDGSAFAYGADDLRVLYRYYDIDEDESAESRTIREGLSDAASSSEVRDAAERLGAEYVMLLDVDPADQSGVCDYWSERDRWQGIWSIDDDTPGFEVVLEQGDMRLYRITG